MRFFDPFDVDLMSMNDDTSSNVEITRKTAAAVFVATKGMKHLIISDIVTVIQINYSLDSYFFTLEVSTFWSTAISFTTPSRLLRRYVERMANEMIENPRQMTPMNRPPLVRLQQQQNFSICLELFRKE